MYQNKYYIFKLPFYGDESFRMRKRLTKLLQEFYPQIKLNVVFYNNFRIKSFFRFKDSVPDSLISSLVYKFQCDRCQSVYVGKTTRHLTVRISEHIGESYRTGSALASPPYSSIRDHSQTHNNHRITRDQFSVIATANSDSELLIREAILIQQMQPILNNMEAINLNVL